MVDPKNIIISSILAVTALAAPAVSMQDSSSADLQSNTPNLPPTYTPTLASNGLCGKHLHPKNWKVDLLDNSTPPLNPSAKIGPGPTSAHGLPRTRTTRSESERPEGLSSGSMAISLGGLLAMDGGIRLRLLMGRRSGIRTSVRTGFIRVRDLVMGRDMNLICGVSLTVRRLMWSFGKASISDP
ncbi:hypothetical protein D6D05_08408 [Aureobasidium pullulans]|nr:hypothetical protein D6D05_08408 [Aureobasidium pullulans]